MRTLVFAILSTVVLTPAFGQTYTFHLSQQSMYKWYGDSDFPRVDGEVSITSLHPDAEWEVTVDRHDDGTMTVRIDGTNIIPIDPPGGKDIKIAELSIGDAQFDILFDNSYYIAATCSEGGFGGGWATFHGLTPGVDWPVGYCEVANVEAEPGYYFAGWTGLAVDLGCVQDPTSTTLFLDVLRYFGIASTQCYLLAQFAPISSPDAVAGVLVTTKEIIAALPVECFHSKNSVKPLTKKIDAVLAMIESGAYEAALDKLQNDLLRKMDGCAERGAPDKNDWIVTCEAQQQVYPLIVQAIELLQGLLE